MSNELVIEAETYIRLSIAGDEALVAAVAARVSERLRVNAGTVSSGED